MIVHTLKSVQLSKSSDIYASLVWCEEHFGKCIYDMKRRPEYVADTWSFSEYDFTFRFRDDNEATLFALRWT